MIEYASKFVELSRYVHAAIDTVIKRNEKFILGLRPEIASVTLPHLHDPCNVIVEMAIRHEEMIAAYGKEKQIETKSSLGKKRKFFKKKGTLKGEASKNAKV